MVSIVELYKYSTEKIKVMLVASELHIFYVPTYFYVLQDGYEQN